MSLLLFKTDCNWLNTDIVAFEILKTKTPHDNLLALIAARFLRKHSAKTFTETYEKFKKQLLFSWNFDTWLSE